MVIKNINTYIKQNNYFEKQDVIYLEAILKIKFLMNLNLKENIRN